jgi:hypothetical protein
MRKLIALSAALGAAPMLVFAVMQTAAPAYADTPGVSPTCFPQTLNPHPTDPAGTTTNTLFCTPQTTPASGSGSGSVGKSGTGTSGAGTTAGGGQTSLASSTSSGTTGSGTTGSGPDESMHSTSNGSGKSTGNTGLFGGLVGFFSAAGGLALLFGLLLLMLLVLVAIAIAAAFRRGPAKNWGSRFSSLTHRA